LPASGCPASYRFFFTWRQTARKQKQALVMTEFSGISLHGEFKKKANISTKKSPKNLQKI
jgi:hypothetical protein